jgi:hypothetical protein
MHIPRLKAADAGHKAGAGCIEQEGNETDGQKCQAKE